MRSMAVAPQSSMRWSAWSDSPAGFPSRVPFVSNSVFKVQRQSLQKVAEFWLAAAAEERGRREEGGGGAGGRRSESVYKHVLKKGNKVYCTKAFSSELIYKHIVP
jgi:hypothetical protein